MSLSDAEKRAFLASHDKCYLATVSENGWPHVVPLAYTMLPDDDRIYLLTHPDQRKSRNIFHDNRVGVLVEEGHTYLDLKGVFVHGYATLVRDTDRYPELEAHWEEGFYDGRIPDVVKKVYDTRDNWLWFAVDPAHTVSWDNSVIDPERLADRDVPEGSPFTYDLPEDAGAAEPE